MLKSVFFGSLFTAIIAVATLIVFLPTPEQTNSSVVPEPTALANEDVQDGVHIPGNNFVITNVRLFDGKLIREGLDLHVHDGVIAAIGEDVSIPEGVPVLDAKNKTLIPGLIDAHTHSWNTALIEALQFGVTTNVDMFTSPETLKSTIANRTTFSKNNEAALYLSLIHI